jgi:hypothetical protein
MKKIALLALVAAGLVALPATAQAKEIVKLKICGASACNEVTDPAKLKGWESESNTDPTSVAVAKPGPYYTVEISFGDNGQVIHRETAYWLPDTNLMRFSETQDSSWWQLFPNQISLYKDAASGIDPFTPSLSRVTVGGKAVADPNSYLRLLGPFRWATLPRGKLHTVRIVLRSSQTNPWVDGRALIRYDAKRRLLLRDDGYFRLPKTLAKLVMKRSSLASSSPQSGSGNGHTALYAGLGAGVVAAAGILAVARRKKIH